MAVETVPVEVSDSELFQGAMAEEPKQETPVEEVQPERPRDESGRFVPKSEPETVLAEAKPEPAKPEVQPDLTKDEAHVPSWRLREVTAEREAATQKAEQATRESYAFQQQLQAMQRTLDGLQKPKAEPVDFFQNPEEALAQRLSPVEQNFQSLASRLTLRASRAEAISEFGKPAVVEMENAVEKASQQNHPDIPLLAAQMRASDDPVGIAMRWYKRSALLERTGGDLDAYVQKQLDEKLKDPAFLAKAVETARAQAGQARPSINLPPSLNKVPGSGASASEADDSDMSDRALFKDAVASKRR